MRSRIERRIVVIIRPERVDVIHADGSVSHHSRVPAVIVRPAGIEIIDRG